MTRIVNEAVGGFLRICNRYLKKFGPMVRFDPGSFWFADQLTIDFIGGPVTVGAKAIREKNNVDQLPTLPVVPMRVADLINDPTSTISDISRELRGDPSLSAKILQLANSSYYAIPGGVSNIEKALAFLGFNTVGQLVLGISVFSYFKKEEASGFSFADFWKHSIGVALASELIAKSVKYPRPEEVFTCGLLHDIGKLVQFVLDPASFFRTLQTAKEMRCSFMDAEIKHEVVNHCFVGESLLKHWKLPLVLQSAVRFHHQSNLESAKVLPAIEPVIRIVQLANELTRKLGIGNSGNFSADERVCEAAKHLNLTPKNLESIEQTLKDSSERAGAFLSACG